MEDLHDFRLKEHEWLASTDAYALINHLVVMGHLCTREGDLSGERKMRLFGVACCRHIQTWSDLPIIAETVDVAERFADGEVDVEELDGLQKVVEGVAYPRDGSTGDDPGFNFPSLRLARSVSLISRFDDGWTYYNHIWEVLHEMRVRSPETVQERANAKATATMFRDIFGNPFRPITPDPAWLTSQVLALARGIYDESAFDRMPILADALQDAGCDNDDVLNHCRGDGLHVRGCWVVDLVLGKA